jgi:hypothetical protein
MAVGKGDFFRVCRWLHGYLSAFAFLSLMFFSVTGLILNHPDWTRAQPKETTVTTTVSPKLIAAAQTAPSPGLAMLKAVAATTPVVGKLKSSDVEGDQALIRLEGPKGSTDITLDLKTGKAETVVSRTNTLTLLNELHKGRDAGLAWKAFIDLSAVVFLLLSVVGYVLFFSLRFRLRSSLVVTAVSLVLMALLVWLLVS